MGKRDQPENQQQRQVCAVSGEAPAGDGTLYIKTSGNRTLRQVARGDSALFTADSRFVVFAIKPLFKDVRQAKIKKKKPEEMPKDSLGVFALETGKLTRYADVKSFQLAEKARW
ncbi:hypothetical protein [Hymenobacter sp. AT01-02]|uniref:hypothetical protein n=1 Tax=Hymenobacter sp. AT01-02 TaxID=1571877 RepID=UPI0005F1D78F|nr:hypothetical protein [Hymenobacter sp. AT01-02]